MNSELREKRIRLVGDGYGAIARMAKLLGTKYRTYQDWELGVASCPDVAMVAIDALTLLQDLEADSASLDQIGKRFPEILSL